MQAILIEIIAAAITGGVSGVGTYLASLGTAQWLTLALGIAEELTPSVAAKLGVAHPSLASLVKNISDGVAKELAAKTAQDFFRANADAAIKAQPGMGADY